FRQEGPVGVPGRLQPAPGLVVGQVVVEVDGAFQGGERVVELDVAVGEFAVQHLGGDGEDVRAGVVEQHPGLGDPLHGGAEGGAFHLGPVDGAGRGEGDAAGVVQHRGGHAVQPRVVGE